MIPLVALYAYIEEPKPIFVVEKNGVRVEVVEVAKVGVSNVDFVTRVVCAGFPVSDLKYVMVIPYIEGRSGEWFDLNPYKLEPYNHSQRTMISAGEKMVQQWTGNIRLTILSAPLSPEKIRMDAIALQPKAIRIFLEQGIVRPKMTEEQVILALGKPTAINETFAGGRKSQQWVYGIGDYVYFERDLVTSWQRRR